MNNNNSSEHIECLKTLNHYMYIDDGYEMYRIISDILKSMHSHICDGICEQEFYDFFDDFSGYVRDYETIEISNKRDEFFLECATQICDHLNGKSLLLDSISNKYSEWKHQEYLERYYAPTGIKWKNKWCDNCIESMYRRNSQCYSRGGSIYLPKESLLKDAEGNVICEAFIEIPKPITFEEIDFDCKEENICAICNQRIKEYEGSLIYRTDINLLYPYLRGIVDYNVHDTCFNSDNGIQMLNNKIECAVENANKAHAEYLRNIHETRI